MNAFLLPRDLPVPNGRNKRYWVVGAVAVLAGLFLTASTGHADTFDGTLYFTHFAGGGDNVLKVGFSYDDGPKTLSIGAQVGISNVFGADGIMFAPNGNLLVTSNATGNVYRIDAATGGVLQTVSTGTPFTPDFHMALDPSGTKFYSSDRYTRFAGPLDVFGINANGTITNATPQTIHGNDPNVTQLAFSPTGKTLYTDGTPNAFGSIGVFDSNTNTTTQLIPGGLVRAAHGIIYDPFTGLDTMFGGGAVATIDPNGATNTDIRNSLKQFQVPGIGDFDQGAVDGLGHAFIAGSGAITFIDYSQSHDITHPDKIIITGGFGDIDDVAPLVGLGAPPGVPEPSSLTLLGLGGVGLAGWRWRRRKLAAA